MGGEVGHLSASFRSPKTCPPPQDVVLHHYIAKDLRDLKDLRKIFKIW